MVDELLALRSLAAETFDLELYVIAIVKQRLSETKTLLPCRQSTVDGLYVVVAAPHPPVQRAVSRNEQPLRKSLSELC
jgi:hypothetical protein